MKDEIKKKSLKRQVELLQMDRIVIIDRLFKLEERIFFLETHVAKLEEKDQPSK